MAITVGELVAVPSLGTRAVAGSSGLDRRISWAHVCELADPWRWLGPDELLMTTGIGVPAGGAAQARYVTELSRAGVVGIAIGDKMQSPALEPELLTTADDLGIALLLTRAEVPFVALARAVAAANAREEQARLATTERLYHHMRSLPDVENTPQLLRRLGQEIGAELVVVTEGRSVATGARTPGPAAEVARRVAAQPGAHPPVRRLADGAVAVQLAGPRRATLVALPQSGRHLDLGLVQHSAAVVSAQRSAAAAERERARRLGATLVSRILDGSIDPTVALDELVARGLGGTRVVAVTSGAGADDVWADLHHRFDDAGAPHALATRGSLLVTLLPDDEQALRVLLEGLPPSAHVGVSAPTDRVPDTRAALQQATWALHQARDTDVPVRRYTSDAEFTGFLPGTVAGSEQAARRVLGALIAYDEVKGSRLLLSLRVFLEENRSWQRAAVRLHVHKQTLVYRMERVEELTGRKLNATADVAELWMALQSAIAAGLHEV